MVPAEIFEQIPSSNMNLYKTCKMFYYHIQVGYKHFSLNFNRQHYFRQNNVMMRILSIDHEKDDDMIKKVSENVYHVRHYDMSYPFKNLISVRLHDSFNSELILPLTVKKLYLGTKYNQPLPYLPLLTHLSLGYRFNQPLIHLSNTLIELNTKGQFNDKLILPPKLIRLTLSSNYNHLLNLPKTLKILRLGYRYNQLLLLPTQLEELVLGSKYQQQLILPASLQTLILNQDYDQYLNIMDTQMKNLWLGKNYTQPLLIPPTLKYLHVSHKYPNIIPLQKLPKTLKILEIDFEKFILDHYR